MRILVATIAFGATLGVLFLLSNHGPAQNGQTLAEIAGNIPSSHSATSSKKPVATKTPKPIKTPKPTVPPKPTPIPLPPNSAQIKILSTVPLSFKVKSSAEVSIQTLPNTSCSIKVALPTGSTSSAQGLEPKTTDQSGNTSWKWGISWNTKPGTGKIFLSCSQNLFYYLPFTVSQ